MPPPALMEELEEEILLRFPPHEPARLIHAALVCKRWARLISGPAFRRRFRELHRAPPMLGLLCNGIGDPDGGANSCRFVPTATFRPSPPQAEQRGSWRALDSRHGRVLLLRPAKRFEEGGLVVWDPITDEKRNLPSPPQHTCSLNAVVLCSAAAGACNHLDCHGGPFLVVFVGMDAGETFICSTYSSDAATWSDPISTQCPGDDCLLSITPGTLAGNALYFLFVNRTAALKYDLGSQEASVIGLPPEYTCWRHAVLTATEGGRLGFATVLENKLYVWSRKAAGPEVDAAAGWIQSRVIDLETLVCNDVILTSAALVGSADGVDVFFMYTNDVIYTLDLKTIGVKKVCEGRNVFTVVPYMSFYTPALGAVCTGEEPSAGGSSA
ncbi:unnamed protein product [Urochloa decumbens]|uniref:F-box domain-containing protein n=1 Tax=Urochloa decumbens TaxID=240449 RepID=A0ABC9GBB1_9POAL